MSLQPPAETVEEAFTKITEKQGALQLTADKCL